MSELAKGRPVREENLRESESRYAAARQYLENEWHDPLHFAPHEIPDGMVYQWLRESTLDVPDNSRIVECRRKGWSAVPPERHPDRVFEGFLGRQSHMKGYIHHKGLILFERPKELDDLEKSKFARQNALSVSSLQGTEDFVNNGGRADIKDVGQYAPSNSRGASFQN